MEFVQAFPGTMAVSLHSLAGPLDGGTAAAGPELRGCLPAKWREAVPLISLLEFSYAARGSCQVRG